MKDCECNMSANTTADLGHIRSPEFLMCSRLWYFHWLAGISLKLMVVEFSCEACIFVLILEFKKKHTHSNPFLMWYVHITSKAVGVDVPKVLFLCSLSSWIVHTCWPKLHSKLLFISKSYIFLLSRPIIVMCCAGQHWQSFVSSLVFPIQSSSFINCPLLLAVTLTPLDSTQQWLWLHPAVILTPPSIARDYIRIFLNQYSLSPCMKYF